MTGKVIILIESCHEVANEAFLRVSQIFAALAIIYVTE